MQVKDRGMLSHTEFIDLADGKRKSGSIVFRRSNLDKKLHSFIDSDGLPYVGQTNGSEVAIISLLNDGYNIRNLSFSLSNLESLPSLHDKVLVAVLEARNYDDDEKLNEESDTPSSVSVFQVVEVVSGDCIIVANDALPFGSPVAERRVNLSSIRCPKLESRQREEKPSPYAREAREFLRTRLIGRQVQVSMDYSRKEFDMVGKTGKYIPLICLITDGSVEDEKDICNIVKDQLVDGGTRRNGYARTGKDVVSYENKGNWDERAKRDQMSKEELTNIKKDRLHKWFCVEAINKSVHTACSVIRQLDP
ncbi:ribonuclease TUDOR 1-like protein [Tanacetum coccineum]